MKGVVLLVLILPTVLCHIIGRRYNEDYEVNRRKHVVMYKSKSTHLHGKHLKEHQYSDELRSDGCRPKWPVEFRSCLCQAVPHGEWKTVLDKETGLTKKFRPVICKGDKMLVNNTTPANYFYYCKDKDTKFNVLLPGASKYKVESLPSECDCELDKFPEKKCPEED